MVVVTSKPGTSAPQRRYLRAPVPVYFPESESVPETGVHLRLRTALWSMLRLELGHRAMVGSDQFLYWDPTDPRQCLAPDVLVWLGALRGARLVLARRAQFGARLAASSGP